jgi:Domain of unknown function (DUF4160)
MPIVAIIAAVKIYFYGDDHGLPHFHAIFAGEEAVIIITTLEVRFSSLPKHKLTAVLQWAKINQDKLLENWYRARQNQTLLMIEV